MENSSSSSSTDPFECLPNDVVISIMKKLPNDLKFLTQCSLVSHLFASAILHVPHVKLTLPSIPYPLLIQFGMYDILDGLRSQLKSTYNKSTTLLTKFLDVHSLDLVFSKNDYDVNEDGVLIEAGFMSHLKIESHSRTIGYTSDCNFMYSCILSEWYGDFDSGSMLTSFNRLNIWTEVILWRDLLLMAVTDFPTLQSVTISNPKLSVCMRDEELSEIKKLKEMKNGREIVMRMRRYLLNKKQGFLT